MEGLSHEAAIEYLESLRQQLSQASWNVPNFFPAPAQPSSTLFQTSFPDLRNDAASTVPGIYPPNNALSSTSFLQSQESSATPHQPQSASTSLPSQHLSSLLQEQTLHPESSMTGYESELDLMACLDGLYTPVVNAETQTDISGQVLDRVQYVIGEVDLFACHLARFHAALTELHEIKENFFNAL
jgi:hypothetical protein